MKCIRITMFNIKYSESSTLHVLMQEELRHGLAIKRGGEGGGGIMFFIRKLLAVGFSLAYSLGGGFIYLEMKAD